MNVGRRKAKVGVLVRYKVISLAALVFVCLFANLWYGNKVEAATCANITDKFSEDGETIGGVKKYYNPSLKYACDHGGGPNNYNYGALWISSTNNLSARVNVQEVNDNKVKVKLRGSLLFSNGNYIDGAYAECIKMFIGNKTNNGMFDLSGLELSGTCTVDGEGTWSNRRLFRQGNPSPKTANISYAQQDLDINLQGINSWGGTITRVGGSISYKDLPISVYRCFASLRSTDRCYPSVSNLAISGNAIAAKSTVKSEAQNKTATTGEVISSSKTATLVLDNCVNGCTVTFTHELTKKEYNFGHRLAYKITNGINRTIPKQVNHDWYKTLKLAPMEGTLSPQNDLNNKKSFEIQSVTLYPGEIYCSKMNFGLYRQAEGSGPSSSEMKFSQTCAAAKGVWGTKVEVGVGKDSENKTSTVYIKPESDVFVFADYTSNAQKTYGLKLKQVNIDNMGKNSSFSQSSRSKTLSEFFSEGGLDWANSFMLYGENANSGGANGKVAYKSVSYSKGTKCGTAILSTKRAELGEKWVCSSNTLNSSFDNSLSFAAGNMYKFYAKVNGDSDSTARVPMMVSFETSKKSGVVLDAEVSISKFDGNDGNNDNKLAWVIVPYNFENKTRVTKVGVSEVKYKENGEIGFVVGDNDIYYNVEVLEKDNKAVNEGKYKTDVPNAKSGIVWCSRHNETECDPENGGESIDGKDKDVFSSSDSSRNSRNINLDLTGKGIGVGDIVCVKSWVSPGNSGGDDNINSNWDDGNIVYSEPVCEVVGKSPTIQVWGGNVFSAGKLNVAGSFERTFEVNGTNEVRHYGSFGELGVFTKQEYIQDRLKFASGAAWGYSSFKDGQLWPNPTPEMQNDVYMENSNNGYGGGSNEKPEELVYSYESNNAYNGVSVDEFCKDYETLSENLVNVDPGTSCYKSEKNIEVGLKDNPITISEGRVVIKSEKTIKINSNLQYNENEAAHNSLSEIPKFIIIANNIDISCDVTEIDALLVATKNKNGNGGVVNTCASEKDNKNDKEFSNQLIIRGAVVADQLVANRTFGAGPGVYSIIPAEIIIFDPSLYDYKVKSGNYDPKIVNVTELAPRY